MSQVRTAFGLLLLLGASCGSPSSGPSVPPAPPPAQPPPPPPPPAPAVETSYRNFKEVGLTPQVLPPGRGGVGSVRAYGRFSGSDRLDLFAATLQYTPPGPPAPSLFEFWRQQEDGSYTRDSQLLESTAGCVHPRKALVADFNGDTKPDVFVACHGYDAPPFAGEQNVIVLSQANGRYRTRIAAPDTGFFHSATAADLDADGDPDVLVVNNLSPTPAYVLRNDGTGAFRRELTDRLPASIRNRAYFTVELVDVDGDGRLDVLLGGHEWEGASTIVLIDPGTGDFAAATPRVIPPVPGEGVVLDFAATGGAADRILWVLRTSGGDGTFYASRTIQRVPWPSMIGSTIVTERPAPWFQWIIPTIVNGRRQIASDDATVSLVVPVNP
ncbi:MAG: VCBS repeat-containing protein [Gemmatimonadetes bacterium]|nr:VCBS repeat-containing protein [Gemmatimonadota bacterium]